MPKTLYDEEGNPIEIEEPEEIKQKISQEYETKLKEAEERVKTNEDDPVEKNWRSAREREKKLEKELKDAQDKLKELGHDTSEQAQVTREELEQRINEATTRKLLDIRKNDALSQYGEEERKVIEKNLAKVTYGEEVTAENIVDFVEQAEQFSFPQSSNPVRRAMSSSLGRPPRTGKTSFGDTEAGQELAKKLGFNI